MDQRDNETKFSFPRGDPILCPLCRTPIKRLCDLYKHLRTQHDLACRAITGPVVNGGVPFVFVHPRVPPHSVAEPATPLASEPDRRRIKLSQTTMDRFLVKP